MQGWSGKETVSKLLILLIRRHSDSLCVHFCVFFLLKRGLVRTKLPCVKEVLKLAMFKLLKHLAGIGQTPGSSRKVFVALRAIGYAMGFHSRYRYKQFLLIAPTWPRYIRPVPRISAIDW